MIGKISRGTPIWINQQALKADVRITVGSIVAHFAASPNHMALEKRK
ncbi:MAG: lactate racemase domain-containing protein [Candidatus Bathyarchaeia archaeon]